MARAAVQRSLPIDRQAEEWRDSPDEPIADLASPEAFAVSHDQKYIERTVMLLNGSPRTTRIALASRVGNRTAQRQLASLSDQSYLRASSWPEVSRTARVLRSADLFSGCGLMTLGAWEACRAVGHRLEPALAFDLDGAAVGVYKQNFPEASVQNVPLETIIDGELGSAPTVREHALLAVTEKIDILVGGPPCQGHSNLNNYTRRDDPKNRLYDRMARFAELFRPKHIIVENVSAVLHDKGRVVDKTVASLVRLGYLIGQGIADMSTLGVPQRRRRHVLVASLERRLNVAETLTRYRREPRTLGWAIGDLLHVKPERGFDQAGNANKNNRRRIEHLFREDIYDLPDRMRPDCHRLKEHSYKSVYGRMYWDQPSQTITSGFTCMGQGRYVHPKLHRTLTPHEAARLQFIPDFFRFGDELPRTALTNLIGNAVPAKLTYALAVELLR